MISDEVSQDGKPNRIIHTITPAGKRALRAWSKKPAKHPSIKDEMLVKFYALENVDIGALKDQLSIRIEQHQTKPVSYTHLTLPTIYSV